MEAIGKFLEQVAFWGGANRAPFRKDTRENTKRQMNQMNGYGQEKHLVNESVRERIYIRDTKQLKNRNRDFILDRHIRNIILFVP